MRTSSPFNLSVKAKLLIAFGIILALNFLVGAIGWRGFSNTEVELALLQQRSLPAIDKALALARRCSELAALAPFIDSVQVVNRLDAESVRLINELDELKVLVNAGNRQKKMSIDSADPVLVRLVNQLDNNLRDLIVTTRRGLNLRSDALELRFVFDRRNEILNHLNGMAPIFGNKKILEMSSDFRMLTETIYEGMVTEDLFELDKIQRRFLLQSADLITLDQKISAGKSDISDAVSITAFVATEQRVFDLRRQRLVTQQRTRYLLEAMHATSTQLGNRVSEIVGKVTNEAQARSAATTATLKTGKESIVFLSVASMLTGLLAAFYVLRDLAGNLRGVTDAMTRLSHGDQSVSVPAIGRADELGALARAFDVFKKHSFEREALARRLAENAHMLEAMFANMSDGISVFDEHEKLAVWNPRFLQLNGLDEHAVHHGILLLNIHAMKELKGVQAVHLDGRFLSSNELISVRHDIPVQYEEHYADGSVIELRSQPMPSGGFIVSYTDLTERRATERRLRQAQRMEAVGQLTGGIAHDFNNLLAAVSANLQMLYSALHDDENLARRILRSLEAVERGSSMTQRLLAFSRQQVLRPEVTDVNLLIKGVLDLIGYSLESNIDLKVDLSQDSMLVLIDPGQLEDAILNLVFNSRDAMPEGGVLSLDTCMQIDEVKGMGRFVRVRVVDTGVGMSPDVMARAYEPFFTTKEIGLGTGLGLSMVYGFVQQSGGDIIICSEPGKGTEIAIFLPVVERIPAQMNMLHP